MMRFPTRFAVALTLLAISASACTVAWGQEDRYYESFEDGIPDYFSATRPESLTISPWHYKHGNASLRWDWLAGEELVIHHGIGDIDRLGGFIPPRTRASFSVWVYTREPMPGDLVFEFREGENSTGSFGFPLQLTRWRQARIFYNEFPEGQPTSEVDNIRIVAPADVDQGTVFIDLIRYNTLTYGGPWAVIPEREAQWERPGPDEQRFPLPERVTDEQLAGIRSLMGPAEGEGVGQDRVDSLVQRVQALGIVRDEHGVRGPGIDGRYQFFPSAAEAAALGTTPAYWPDEHGPQWLGMQIPKGMTDLAIHIARAYRASNDPEQRRQLADAFLLLADHLHDQGLQAGTGFWWGWYSGRNWADAVFMMRDALAQAGSLQAHLDFIMYSYDSSDLFTEDAARSGTDFHSVEVTRLLRQSLMQPNPARQVQWLDAFKDMLEQNLVRPRSSFKIDGSAFHHGGHYHHYAQGAFTSLAPLLRDLSGTPWRLGVDAHERVRRAVLAQRIYCNTLDLPLSLSGRATFRPGYGFIRPGSLQAFDALARSGTPDGAQEIDREVAAAYLRLVPEAVNDEPYRTLGIEPEAAPNGTFVTPYAGLLSHRRDDWLASVKGQSRYIWGSSRQDTENCFGYFQGLGQLEILAGGTPVNAEDSGRSPEGWDWRRFEGTTVPQLPLDVIAAGWTSARSREAFVGGLSHQGQQGIFAMIVYQRMPGGSTLTGRKSWFFNDDQIICLGSNISCDEAQYPTQTTLCQRALRSDDQGEFPPTLLDGGELTAFPEERVLDPDEPHWFIDVQQTGYYLPAGLDVTVARRHQQSRDFRDAQDTEGDFLTAWIDHGTTPRNADYEYMLVVRTTPSAMQRIVSNPPYQVLQRDETAHIVWHSGAGRWACVFFVEQEVARHTVAGQTLPVKSVDRPSLVMAEALDDGHLHLSVADPDLNMDPPTGNDVVSEPRPLRIALHGAWRLVDANATINAWPLDGGADSVRIVSASAAETVLEIVCQHGASYGISLARD